MSIAIKRMAFKFSIVKKGWNVKQLAEQVPMDYVYLNKIINGKANPSDLMAIKISNALEVDVSEIFEIKEKV
ncbi:helix-turn-helix transcriptional regulator [Staphylococcus saprophyticus]|uniref:helix-turn-helix domain-containing protein n=1 Tax=Staphylococcus TaxID=1279 RepID=UPI000E08BD35|nr:MULTISPECIES: helix-turn-helix transcriptional regulator [Staphylococcus]HAP2020153.1 helix-turn-helix transcriptional regulator [Escherichia coli]MDL1995597.1 helix-turn-helix transcriptional regulator [Staphylococcus saprophyticus]MDW4329826.1 helix-turn-helix transcriptional regulator [Staphylococcus saprophyticus]MDW4373668.1 helix-turn-helix transcriptional regulator [Staphylococcus saprophyticus]MDW4376279.1 helix-turn-helix transcriptional regulator [Staphylococcus saprophyticus]